MLMSQALRRPAPAALLGVLCACSSPDVGRGIQLRLAAVAPEGGCVKFQLQSGQVGTIATREDAQLTSALLGQSGTLRVSVVRRGADGIDSFVCDATARVPSQVINLDLGTITGARLHAELFDNAGALIATGMTTVEGGATAAGSGAALLNLFPTAGWSCPGAALAFPRAFHAVTPLPSGELLLTGGLTGFGTADGREFQVVSRVEIYDPRRGAFFALEEDRGRVPRGRAFHRAAVLDQGGAGGQVRVLLYGGIADSPGKASIVANSGSADQLLRLAPANTATTISDSEILVIDVANRRVSRPALVSAASFPAAIFSGGVNLPGGGLLAVGGHGLKAASGGGPPLVPVTGMTLVLPQPQSANPTPATAPELGRWLLGPSVTPLTGDQAVVLGAALPAKMGDPSPHAVAAVLSGISGTPQVRLIDPLPGTSPGTAFHTATALPAVSGAPRVLLTGGFVPDSKLLSLQPPDLASGPVRVLTLPASDAPTMTTVMPYGQSGANPAYRPAGWESATALGSSRRVLITGGTPATSESGGECLGNDLLCALRQASLFDADQGTLQAAPQLALGRLGHRQTLMPDGTVLVTGGLVRRTHPDTKAPLTLATAEAEVYNPRQRQGADIEDLVAGAVARANRSRSGTGTAQACAMVE